MTRVPDLGLLVLVFSSGCATRQAELGFVGQWRVVELRVDGDAIPFPASVTEDGCTTGYEIRAISDGSQGEVRYEYSYECGDDPVYYSLPLPVTIAGNAGTFEVKGLDLAWTCSSAGENSWECSRLDGAVLMLEPL